MRCIVKAVVHFILLNDVTWQILQVSAAKIGQCCAVTSSKLPQAEFKSDVNSLLQLRPTALCVSSDRESNQGQRIHFPCYFF